MNEARSACFFIGDSMVLAIARNDPASLDLLDQHFGRGLRFLINRRCSDNEHECFASVIQESIQAIQAGHISTDSQIPGLLRKLCNKISSQYPTQIRKSAQDRCDDAIAAKCAKNLTIFTPVQLEALRRFYGEGEAASLVCQSLGLHSEQFNFIRKVALQSATRIRRLRKPARSACNQEETRAALVSGSA